MTKLVPENVLFYGNIPLAEDKHAMIVVFGVISAVGILSLLLDLIYSCFDSGVFNSSKMQIEGEATLQLSEKNNKTNTPSCGKYSQWLTFTDMAKFHDQWNYWYGLMVEPL